jgi:ATP-dependent exoDNAse (exonuclease V) alpha subunit
MNSGTTKLSTVHSFKGWEIQTLFLLIETKSDESVLTDELIYTALTRCRQNLVIINIGNEKYDKFFKEWRLSNETKTKSLFAHN